jgi:hypothetical protein
VVEDFGKRIEVMNARVAFWLAWLLGGLSVAMFVAGVAFTTLSLLAGVDRPSGTVGDLVRYVPFLAFPIVGALIASRRPGNPIGWICLTAGLFWMLFVVVAQYDAYELATTGTLTSSATFDALYAWLWVPPIGLPGIYMILLFPDGRLPSKRWRPFAWFAGTVMAVICVGFIFIPGPLEGNPGVRNPLGLEWLAWVRDVEIFIILLFPLCILVSASSLVLRYRRSEGEVRAQIKWLVFAACFFGVFYLGSLLGQFLFAPESGEAEGSSAPLWVTIVNNLRLISFAGVPVAVGIAILRYRLYDIEIIINRALVYGSLTATLVGIYFGGVVSLQYAFRALTGSESQLAVVASTLAIAALFVPLRRRVQALIDRRFYRKKYDARKTLDGFGARLRDETDLEVLRGDLVAVVRDTVQPAHVSLWLREPKQDRGGRA